jgi:hypothetical protein
MVILIHHPPALAKVRYRFHTGWTCPDVSCGQAFDMELHFSQHHLFHDDDGARHDAFSRFINDAMQTLLGLNRFWETFESPGGQVSYDAVTLLEIMQAVSRRQLLMTWKELKGNRSGSMYLRPLTDSVERWCLP